MTNRIIILVFLTIAFFGCKPPASTFSKSEVISGYYSGLNNSDFNKIAELVTDSFKITEGEFEVVKNKIDFYRQFRWDSVFKPKYEILEMAITDSANEITLSKICKRIRFLHDTPTVYKIVVYFESGKISKLEHTNYIKFDFDKWEERRDTLVNWIKINHPELDGFVYDQTKKGAENYLKAIDLFLKKYY